jgi:hypothetical protein
MVDLLKMGHMHSIVVSRAYFYFFLRTVSYKFTIPEFQVYLNLKKESTRADYNSLSFIQTSKMLKSFSTYTEAESVSQNNDQNTKLGGVN